MDFNINGSSEIRDSKLISWIETKIENFKFDYNLGVPKTSSNKTIIIIRELYDLIKDHDTTLENIDSIINVWRSLILFSMSHSNSKNIILINVDNWNIDSEYRGTILKSIGFHEEYDDDYIPPEKSDIELSCEILTHLSTQGLNISLNNSVFATKPLNVKITNDIIIAPLISKTAIIVPFFNFNENPIMVENFNKFKSQIPKEDLFVIELSYNDLPFYIEDSNRFIRLRGSDQHLMWQKERLLNIALNHIPKQYTNIAWFDGDIMFENRNFIMDIGLKLSDYDIVQAFDTANFLNKDGSVDRSWRSVLQTPEFGGVGHTGFGWAARREVLDHIGFFDSHITGNGDSYLYYIFGNNEIPMWNMPIMKLIGFKYKVEKYRRLVSNYGGCSISNIDGIISHLYHGSFKNRQYLNRQDILIINEFDPVEDLFIDDNGLYCWNYNSKNATSIKTEIKEYLNTRRELDL